MKFQKQMEHKGSAQKHEDFACFVQQQKPRDPGRDPQGRTALLHLAPPCSSAPALSTAQAVITWQAGGSTLCTLTTSQNFEMSANITGASRRRLTSFYFACQFVLALCPSAKPLLAKKPLAKQKRTVSLFFLCDVQGLILLKYRINNRLKQSTTSKFPSLFSPTCINQVRNTKQT